MAHDERSIATELEVVHSMHNLSCSQKMLRSCSESLRLPICQLLRDDMFEISLRAADNVLSAEASTAGSTMCFMVSLAMHRGTTCFR